MSANSIYLVEFVAALSEEVKRHDERIHPMGEQAIHEWMVDAYNAAHDGDAHEVKRLTGMVRGKLKQERLWRLQCWLTCQDHHPRIAEWLHKELQVG